MIGAVIELVALVSVALGASAALKQRAGAARLVGLIPVALFTIGALLPVVAQGGSAAHIAGLSLVLLGGALGVSLVLAPPTPEPASVPLEDDRRSP